MRIVAHTGTVTGSFSALQRAEIAEMRAYTWCDPTTPGFSALQRAEIAEIEGAESAPQREKSVSVLFNEPKLLKYACISFIYRACCEFQCSSTSRNC